LSEIEGFCDDVVILNSGQVVAKGSVADVIGKAQTRNSGTIRIHVPSPSVTKAQQVLKSLKNVVKVTTSGDTADWLEVELEEPAKKNSSEEHLIKNKILDSLLQAEIPILSFDAEGSRLQDVFLQLTEEDIK
jgi:ABC-2 type transport system ATP-binding protein